MKTQAMERRWIVRGGTLQEWRRQDAGKDSNHDAQRRPRSPFFFANNSRWARSGGGIRLPYHSSCRCLRPPKRVDGFPRRVAE